MVQIIFTCETAGQARAEMLELLGLSTSAKTCCPVEPAEVVEAAEAADESESADEPAASGKKKRRGRPPKVTTEEEVTPSTTDANGVEYEDVATPRTVADLRAACIAAADRVGVDVVQKLLQDNYKTAVAAEVPADKLSGAFDAVSALSADERPF